MADIRSEDHAAIVRGSLCSDSLMELILSATFWADEPTRIECSKATKRMVVALLVALAKESDRVLASCRYRQADIYAKFDLPDGVLVASGSKRPAYLILDPHMSVEVQRLVGVGKEWLDQYEAAMPVTPLA